MSIKGLDSKRLERQQLVVDRWIKAGYKGTFLGATGVGKSFIAVLCIKHVLGLRPNASILVVVPTVYLQNQWRDLLKRFGLKKVKILVINTASKIEEDVDFLVVDEAHVAGADKFSNIFEGIKYKIILCLTATIERSDGKHDLILDKAPVFDEIGLEEALNNGYISNYKIFNLPVPFNDAEKKEYDKTQRNYLYYEGLLGGRYSAWGKSWQILRDDDADDEEKKRAMMFVRLVNKRKTLLQNSKSKLKAAQDILNLFPDRNSIIFCESVSFAIDLHNHLKTTSVLYHSGLNTNQKKLAIGRFSDNRTKANTLISCRALDAGVDISGVNLGICCAGTSRQLQSIQRLGRSIRLNKNNTIAYYFNLYVPGTQEEKWLKSRCYNMPNVEWIESLNEIQ